MIISRSIIPRMENVLDKIIKKVKTRILYTVTYFFKSSRLCDNVKNYFGIGQATDGNMAHAHCVQDIEDCKHDTLIICNTYCC